MFWHYHNYELNDSVNTVYDAAYDAAHESNRYSLNNVKNNKTYAHRIYDPNAGTLNEGNLSMTNESKKNDKNMHNYGC